jgi:two-component system response regulator RegX3
VNERVLVVDDEPSVHVVVRAYLEREGFVVLSAGDGREGLRLAEERRPALIVLDLMLPDLSGEELAREVRRRSDVPILMLTARSAEEDRVAGLELGADDYLTKPFSARELVARIKAVLRRASDNDDAPLLARMHLDDGSLVLDTDRHEVTVAGAAVQLTASEFRLLVALARHPGRVYSRAELVERLQGQDGAGNARAIDRHVKNLRRKLGDDPRNPRYVVTVQGVGYKLGVR